MLAGVSSEDQFNNTKALIYTRIYSNLLNEIVMAQIIFLIFIITAYNVRLTDKNVYLEVMSRIVGVSISLGVSSMVVNWVPLLFPQAYVVQTSTCKQWFRKAYIQLFPRSRLPMTECHPSPFHMNLLTASWVSLNINF